MIRRLALLGAALALLAACNTPPTATPTPTPTVTPSPTPSPTPWATATRIPTTPGYRAMALSLVPEESIVNFSIPFMGNEVKGALGVRTGTITLIESEAGSHVFVEMHIDMPSIHTGSGLLDDILRRLLQVDQYPTALFTGAALDATPGLYPRGETVYVAMPAELRIAAESVSETVDTEAVLRDRRMEVVADFRVQLADAGITPPPLVGEYIHFRVEVVTR